jgi:hypothetical protein
VAGLQSVEGFCEGVGVEGLGVSTVVLRGAALRAGYSIVVDVFQKLDYFSVGESAKKRMHLAAPKSALARF